MQRLLTLLSLGLLCSLGPSCAKAPSAPRKGGGPVAAGLQAALKAGTRSFDATQLEEWATLRGLTTTAAAQELAIQSLVADEGARLGQPCTEAETLEACSARILLALFPDNPDCQGISERELDQFYELSYTTQWLFDYYEGASLSLGLADPAKAGGATAELRRLAALWNYRKDLDGALARLAPEGYRELPFKVLLRPDRPPADQGWQSGLPPEALATLTTMKPGQLGQPMVVGDLALVLRLDLHTPPKLKQDPAVRADLRRQLCLNKSAAAREKWTADLRRAGFVEINLPPQGKRN